MCGIGGCVLARDAVPDPQHLAAMRDALSHRGPDDSGVTIVRNVGLVHTRLSIVDPSRNGHQPASDRHGRWWLTYNGEIFNHLELRQRLGDVELVSESDTHTLLHALVHWDVDALSMLNGQFAFAASDLERGRLLLARDRFGIKPLYVASTADGVWFASEPEALVAAGVRVRAHDDAWQSMLTGSCYGGSTTMLSPVNRVPPGSYVEVPLRQPDPAFQRWHSVADQVDPERQNRLTQQPREVLVRGLEGALRSAVHDALMGDVAIGMFCSGGVDSSRGRARGCPRRVDGQTVVPTELGLPCGTS